MLNFDYFYIQKKCVLQKTTVIPVNFHSNGMVIPILHAHAMEAMIHLGATPPRAIGIIVKLELILLVRVTIR